MMPVAVITGGNRGLGFFQTKTFLEHGYRVFVVSRTEIGLSELEEIAKPGQLTPVKKDLSSWRDTAFLEEIHTETGMIDVLINNAGVHLKKPAWDVTADELESLLDVNVKALFSSCGRYVELQQHKGGAIVNLSSMAGLMALPNAAAYVASKTAVIGLTRSIALDAAPFGIRCNAVCPGFIDTDMTRAVLAKDPARRARIEDRIPGHRFGAPEDVANACFFLASPEARYINGVSLPVDAGFSIGF